PARRRESRSGDPLADLPEDPGAVSARWRRVPRSDPEPLVELHRSAASVVRGARKRDQRARAGGRRRSGERKYDQSGATAPWLRRAEGRWDDALRQLAVLRLVDRSRRDVA